MKRIFRLEGLGCANCAAKMEKAIQELAGVREASVNFMTTKLVIDAEDDKMEDILATSEKIIHKLEPDVTMKRI